MTDYNNILIIKMSSLGDTIHALPTLYALRRRFPNARITWAVHPAFSALLPGMPWLDEIILINRKRIRQFSYWKELRRDLHKRHFDLVIDLQMIAKSAVVSFLSGGKRKIGYWDAREGSFLASEPIKGAHQKGHIIEQLLDVATYLGCDTSEIHFPIREHEKETETVRQFLSENGIEGRYVVLVPGTRGEHKKWPLAYWGELAKRMAGDGIFSVISGSPGEEEMGEEIKKFSPSSRTVNLIGKTNLLELCALDEMAALHISGDTGPLHIANAVGTPLIALFGPTPYYRNGPLGNPAADVILADNPGKETTKMETISVEAVYDLARKKLKAEK